MQIEIKKHGEKHLEIKSTLPITHKDKDSLKLDFWLFIPGSLRINKHDYGISGFFSDIRQLTRFSPPRIPLDKIINPEYELSPLTRIINILDNAGLKKDIPGKLIIYEMRSLANIYSSEANDFLSINFSPGFQNQFMQIEPGIRKRFKDITFFLEKWRSLYTSFLSPNISEKLREAYRWTDESISLTTEETLFVMYEHLSSFNKTLPLIDSIKELMKSEIAYRKSVNVLYLQKDSPQEDIEHRIYRRSILKKWTQSALYLTKEFSSSGKRWEHALAGIAAAIAMTIGVVGTLIDQKYFPNNRIPWAAIIILTYMFRDRIKEILRRNLVKSFRRLISDEMVYLVDQAANQKIGKVKGQVQFLKSSQTPREIQQRRHSGKNPFKNLLPEEDVIYFRRDFSINNKTLRENHNRLENLTDILRLNLDRFLKEMDSPEKKIPSFAFSPPKIISGKRIYHLYLIAGLSKSDSEQRRVYRLNVSRNGIERIKLISS